MDRLHLGVLLRNSLKTRVTLFTLVVFLLSLWSLAFYVSHMLREDLQHLAEEQLFSNASLLAKEINDQLADRIKALEIVANSFETSEIDRPPAIQKRLEQRPILQLLFNAGTFVTDAQGTAVASLPVAARRVGLNYMERSHVATALRDGQTTFSPPFLGKLHYPAVSIAVPIRNARGKVLGVLVGVTDLSQPNFLDKVTQSHYGKSGGYILVAPQYRLTVTATDKTRVMTAFPKPGVNPLFDRVLQGYEGSGRVVDSRGLEVLSAARQVPIANWILFVRLPVEEAFAPIRDMQYRTLTVAIVLTLLAGLATWWMLRRQLEPMSAAVRALQALPGTDQHKYPLPVFRQDEIGQLIGGFNRLLKTLGERERALRDSEQLLRESQHIAGLGSYSLDFKSGLWTSSSVLDRLFGIDEAYVRSLEGWLALVHPEDRQMMMNYFQQQVVGQRQRFDKVYRILRPVDGVVCWLHGLGQLELDAEGKLLKLNGTVQDITQRHANEEQIKRLAYSDPLTLLPNRRFLMDRIEKAIANGLRHRTQGALLMVDLDNFKTLNDSQGHDQGDRLLEEVARRLLSCVREGDTVARLGGDEFVVLLEDLSPIADEAAIQAKHVGDKILLELTRPLLLGSATHHASACIGVTLFGDATESIENPLKRADLAMYQAKTAGHNMLRFFDQQMQVAVNARAAMEMDLRQAWGKKQFMLHYQPQVNDQGRVTGVEALLRWNHPVRGLVSPAEFIPLAEESGLILQIGRWVQEVACQQLARWATIPELSQLSMAVNVSVRQFSQTDFVEQVLSVLEHTGARAHLLKLELTESVLLVNAEDVIAKMNALKKQGVCFSLDDFGTGYSSLYYLKRLPLDQLKIDQGFVRDILIDPNDAAIARMVIALAGTLGLAVIAEGVELEGQRDFLASLGCHEYQGYLFGRPVPIEELELLVEKV